MRTIREAMVEYSPSQNHDELEAFLLCMSRNKVGPVKTILEIGVHRGGSFLIWKEFFNPELIIGIDNYVPGSEELQEKIKDDPNAIYMAPYDSNSPSTKTLVEAMLGERKIDFLFIDGDHNYKAVKEDWNLYKDLLAEDAAVGFHDISITNREDIGVHKFWKEITSQYINFEFRNSEGTGTGLIFLQ